MVNRSNVDRWYHKLMWWTLPPAVIVLLIAMGMPSKQRLVTLVPVGEQDGYQVLDPMYKVQLLTDANYIGADHIKQGVTHLRCEPSIIDVDPTEQEDRRMLLSCEGGAQFVVRGIRWQEER